MPELPEVETVRSGLAPHMEGQIITTCQLNRPDLRFPFPAQFAEALSGRTIVAMGRRAKILLMALDDGWVVMMHLGMSGRFIIETADQRAVPGDFAHRSGANPKHDHVIFHLASGTHILYNDPRRFGYMDRVRQEELEEHPSVRSLGPEPTGNALSEQTFASRVKGRKTPLKTALLDQRIIAGLGNIYVCEAMWRARLSPFMPVGALVGADGAPGPHCAELVRMIRAVIAEAIAAGGSSLKDYRQADGALGYFQHRFAVYDQEGAPCRHEACTGTIARAVQAGRSTFYCPTCQMG